MKLVSIAEIAGALDLSTDYVRKLTQSGKIPAYRASKRGDWKYDPIEVRQALRYRPFEHSSPGLTGDAA